MSKKIILNMPKKSKPQPKSNNEPKKANPQPESNNEPLLPYVYQKKNTKKRVEKLDNPEVYGDIGSNRTSSSTLTKNVQDRYSVWWNHFKANPGKVVLPKNKSNITWVGEYYEEILEFIQTRYMNSDIYADSTRRNMLEGFLNALLTIDKERFREWSRQYWNQALEIQVEIDLKRDENLLSDEDLSNFVSYPEVLQERQKWELELQKNPKNLKNDMYHLILAINTYIPPLRLDFCGMQIWNDKKEPPENEINYLWRHAANDYSIVINQDKVSNYEKQKNQPRGVYRLSDEIEGVTNGAKLNQILEQSLKNHKRDFVLIGVRNESAMIENSYRQALHTIFKPRKPGQNLIRKMYVNHFHNIPNISTSTLKKIAYRQRHSLLVAKESYFKVNINPGMQKPITGHVFPPNLEIPNPWKDMESKPKFDLKEYTREYRKKNKEKLDAQRKKNYQNNKDKILRYKILYYLNNGLVKHPQQASIDKYDINYDAKNKKWI